MITPEFKKAYKNLNKEQREAVDAIEGPVMVIAGPGTGKTTVLTLRIANILLKTDTPPSGVLALTFTDAGAKRMKAKLREIIGERSFEVVVHTFHGFAASIIAEFGDHFSHLSKTRQITEIESESLLREILKQKKFAKLRPLGDPDFYIGKIIEAISQARKEAWTPEAIRSFAEEEIERIEADPNSIATRGRSSGQIKAESLKRIEKCQRTLILADVYEAYENKKREEKKIDFDDLIFELLQALKQDELLLRILQERFLYILLDEHQDTNDAQNLIVKRLADFFSSPNLFVVGDDKQAIYRFQGASVENFLSFQRTWSDMKVIFLSDNYRSHQHILDASFEMIERNYENGEHPHLRLKLKSKAREKNKPLDLIIAPDAGTEEKQLVKEISKLLVRKTPPSIAVIVRKNSEAARIFSLLEANNIRATAERVANIFSHPAGRTFFSLLEFLYDPSHLESLAGTLAAGLWNLNFKKRVEFIKLVKSGNLAAIVKDIPALAKLHKEISAAGPIEYIYLAADLSGFSEILIYDPLSVEVWRGIISLAEDLVGAYSIEDPRDLIKKMLDYKKSADRKVIKINAGDVDSRIAIMTAHGSKGLEFDYVFLPFATEELWGIKNRGSYFVLPKEKEGGDDIRDERRLFYVAVTRARKHVAISLHQKDWAGRESSPLRFIEELNQNFISRREISKTSLTISRGLSKTKKRKNLEETEYTKRILLENGLSVTALNHFLECPNKFFYKSILKLPEAPTSSSEKGSAMHEALANVWNLTPSPSPINRRGEKEILSIITTSVKNYFRRSFLSLFDKEAVLEELLADAPKVAAALESHFVQEGSIATEKWAEKFFTTDFGQKKIEIKLHGRLDALVEQPGKILVYDYKTREAMSPKAIKARPNGSSGRRETQNSNGNYFRQLVFYKMLLAGNNQFKDKIIEPALVFIKPDKQRRCPTISLPIEKSDITNLESEITSLIKSVWSGKFLSQTCSNPNCQYCGYKRLLEK